MTLFEFLTVAVSIVLALGLVRLVHGLPIASRAETRYWIHLAYVVNLGVVHLLFWWALWGFQSSVDWNFGRFLFVFIGPILLFSLASTLIPDDPGNVPSWRNHFYQTRRTFFLVWAAFTLHQALAPILVQGVRPRLAMWPVFLFGVSVPFLGAYSKSPRLHSFLIVAIYVALVSSMFISFRPVSYNG